MVLSRPLHPFLLLSPLFQLICETGLVCFWQGCSERKGDEICLSGGEGWDRELRAAYRHVQSVVRK